MTRHVFPSFYCLSVCGASVQVLRDCGGEFDFIIGRRRDSERDGPTVDLRLLIIDPGDES